MEQQNKPITIDDLTEEEVGLVLNFKMLTQEQKEAALQIIKEIANENSSK